MAENLLAGLNEVQRKAVKFFDGPLQIIAGAGSGKTKVITHKIAYLIKELNHSPFQILAVTFTNRAASEMKERVSALTNIESNQLFISTFHSLGLRILRESSTIMAFDRDWQVVDDTDQKKIIERIIKDRCPHYTNDMRDATRSKINWAKMNLYYPNNPDLLYSRGFTEEEVNLFSAYYEYQKKAKIWDYEDLISIPVKMFQNDDRIKKKYRDKFRYVMVDEFQDTNPNQYELIRQIAMGHQKITVVGDDDQAIYSWRGANLKFLFDFERDFPNTTMIKLEQNYRSTKPILDFANSLISKNAFRRAKAMWTQQEQGKPVYFLSSHSKEEEAKKVAELILTMKQHQSNTMPLAVLYRINSQSLAFETEFTQSNIKFEIIKGQRFFDRKEIKDSLALLKLSVNPDDDVSFTRVVDFLPLGIGAKTFNKISMQAGENKASLFHTLKTTFTDKYQRCPILIKIDELHHRRVHLTLFERLALLLDISGYIEYLQEKMEESRLLNIEELKTFIASWETSHPDKQFNDLLDTISLTSQNEKSRGSKADAYLLTMHNAKGLEFPSVVVSGINSTYMPFFMRKGRKELEEERRLFYVACTRAIHQLIVSSGSYKPSTFLKELDFSLYQTIYHAEEVLDRRNITSNAQEIIESNDRYIDHPFFGKGKILNKVGDARYLIDFFEKGEKVIDTAIVPVDFL